MPDEPVDIPVMCSECARQKELIESDKRFEVVSCKPSAEDPRICRLVIKKKTS